MRERPLMLVLLSVLTCVLAVVCAQISDLGCKLLADYPSSPLAVVLRQERFLGEDENPPLRASAESSNSLVERVCRARLY